MSEFEILPLGARCFVEEIEPVDEVTARMAAAGLHAVVLDENVPKPTEGVVVAVGSDPLIQELVRVGDVVTFNRHAGSYQQVEGRTYRNLELRELSAVIRKRSLPEGVHSVSKAAGDGSGSGS